MFFSYRVIWDELFNFSKPQFPPLLKVDNNAYFLMGYVYIYVMEYNSTIKKNEIMPLVATWMDLEIIILSEVSQTEKDKCHMISLICGI